MFTIEAFIKIIPCVEFAMLAHSEKKSINGQCRGKFCSPSSLWLCGAKVLYVLTGICDRIKFVILLSTPILLSIQTD